ncbi:GTPase IMAP family member 8-like [Lagopus leucura]|uniref:GTPase IMAP family member 8-like n=1 Tax=Lagopus leucura TaxID=30410 RepID=UPI001C686564|nr:GTPase IMAP family member 8-like [Lagopus leucura]
MADRTAETGAAVPSRRRTASESPAKAAEPRRAGGRDGSESKRRGHGPRAESAGRREEDESGDGACGSTAEKKGEPRDGASGGGGRRRELRVVLLGRSGAGRSATGNTLLGEERFESRLASQPVTTTCKDGRRDWGEWCVVVMDTPAIFGGSQCDKQHLAEERQRCLRFAAREPCVLLLVTQLGRYTREDREMQADEVLHRAVSIALRQREGRQRKRWWWSRSGRRRFPRTNGARSHRCVLAVALSVPVQPRLSSASAGPRAAAMHSDEPFRQPEPKGCWMRDDKAPPELRLLLVGKSGGGRSATGNSILGRAAFESRLSTRAVTQRSEWQSGSWRGYRLHVVDTPDAFDTPERSARCLREVARCALLSAPGPHALLLVTQLGRFTQEDEAAIRQVWRLFGRGAAERTVVVFTRGDELTGGSLRRHVEDIGTAALRELLRPLPERALRPHDGHTRGSSDDLHYCLLQPICSRGQRHGAEAVLVGAISEPDGAAASVPHFSLPVRRLGLTGGCSVRAWRSAKKGTTTATRRIPVLPGDGRGSTMRLLLVGKTGGGRSATGNTILGRCVFESKLSTRPVTHSCQSAIVHWDGEEIVVVDTADIFHSWNGSNEECREITRCIELSSPGPHVLLLVTQLGRFTQEDQEAVRGVQDIFGVGVFKHMVVVFTRGEELVGGSLRDYVTYTDNAALRRLIQSCQNRYCGINNRASGPQRDQQVQQLMNMIRQTMRENEGRWYSNELYLNPYLTEEKVRYHMENAAKPWGRLLNLSYRGVLLKCGIVLIVIALIVIGVLIWWER